MADVIETLEMYRIVPQKTFTSPAGREFGFVEAWEVAPGPYEYELRCSFLGHTEYCEGYIKKGDNDLERFLVEQFRGYWYFPHKSLEELAAKWCTEGDMTPELAERWLLDKRTKRTEGEIRLLSIIQQRGQAIDAQNLNLTT